MKEDKQGESESREKKTKSWGQKTYHMGGERHRMVHDALSLKRGQHTPGRGRGCSLLGGQGVQRGVRNNAHGAQECACAKGEKAHVARSGVFLRGGGTGGVMEKRLEELHCLLVKTCTLYEKRVGWSRVNAASRDQE